MLVAEDALLIVTEAEGLVSMLKQNADYRRVGTEELRDMFSEDRVRPFSLTELGRLRTIENQGHG